ncbi:hypothetical protein KAFR_0A08210 [Kazachstania africana CBS 2517]|uniref:Uncharacterized protein n=1 Tax=Kazachstania africana (strain ATCC 22294 / BCRC 22015 / CBS 2517 / CECT 1963 / NBRC 1671 / NRRL Y-8276) TaxID=1071382 RepID=H2APF5_KAZAF|nr:hypothetical protein KAFR_0A08210 [Kazachstania africana CBS 2517]CCF56255.1 hypothetical protein KAFR_0A08210 [Kazachstania africana CBS 2517]
MSSNSLKAVEKRVAKRRQVYRPILQSPFVNEEHQWPLVKDQAFVLEVLKTSILSKCQHLQEVPMPEWPWSMLVEYNDIVGYLSGKEDDDALDVLLFVCNKEPDVPGVMLQQIPLLSYMSSHRVTIVQLPKGSLPIINRLVELPYGMLLLKCDSKLDPSFQRQIESQVSPVEGGFPWLDNLKYSATKVKLIKTTAAIPQKNKT